MSVHHYVAAIRAATGRREKADLFRRFLKEDEESGLFRKVVVYAMDPTIMFNMGKRSITTLIIDGVAPVADPDLTMEDFDRLDLMVSRKLSRTDGAKWLNARIQTLRSEEARILVGIIDKDLSWGLGVSSVNEVVPGLITEFFCMLAAKYDPTKITYPCHVEPKFDGMRVLAMVKDREVSFFTRSGKAVESLPIHMYADCVKIADVLAYDGHVVLDGEIMGDSFKETMEKGRRKSEIFSNAKYHIFDWLPHDEYIEIGKGKSKLGYRERRRVLELALSSSKAEACVLPPVYIASSEMEVTHYYEAFRDMGLEGAIIKESDGCYVGKRSSGWIKMKAEETEDLEIIGFEEGEGKYEGKLGALIVNREGVEVRVGSGLSDEDRQMMWSNKDLYRHKLIEVQFQEITPDGSLRHPRYLNLRMDKSAW